MGLIAAVRARHARRVALRRAAGERVTTRGIAAALATGAAEFEGAELALYTRLAVRCERSPRDSNSVTRRSVANWWRR